MKTSRIVCLILAALMLFSAIALASCGKKEKTAPAENTTEPVTEADTSDLYDAKGYLKDSIPQMDYNKDVNILCWNTSQIDEFGTGVQDENTDSISQSFYKRNRTTEARLGVTLLFDQIDGDNPNQKAYCEIAMNEIMGGSKYDLLGCYSMCGGTLAVKNALKDLTALAYPELDKPWWSQEMIEISKINKQLFFATGDISGELLYNMMFLMYNTDIGDNYGLDDPRDFVFDGDWTLEELYKQASGVYADLNESGVKDSGDCFGLIISTQVLIDGFFYGCGYTIAQENDNGDIRLTPEYTGVKAYDLFSGLNRFLQSDFGFYDNGNANFKAGKALFGTANAANFKAVKEAGWGYSLLPFPKADETQKGYYSALGFGHSFYCVPISAADPEMSGTVMECLASEGYRTTTPEIFDRVFFRYTFDDNDWKIFNIIKDGVISDQARIFSARFTWAKGGIGMMRNCVINNTAEGFNNEVRSNEEYINGVFDQILGKDSQS